LTIWLPSDKHGSGYSALGVIDGFSPETAHSIFLNTEQDRGIAKLRPSAIIGLGFRRFFHFDLPFLIQLMLNL